MGKEKSCFECDHSGMDMDLDPYCASPGVMKEHPYGLALNSMKIKDHCPAPEHPLWKLRSKR